MVHGPSQWVIVLQAPAVQVFCVAAFESVGEVGLLGDMNLMLCHEFHGQLGRTHGKMIEIVTVIFPWAAFKGIGQCVHNKHNRGITDGVNAHLISRVVDLIQQGNQFLFRHVEVTSILALVHIRL